MMNRALMHTAPDSVGMPGMNSFLEVKVLYGKGSRNR